MVVSKVQCAFSTIAGSPEQHCVDCQLENKGFVFVEANKALCCLTVLEQRMVLSIITILGLDRCACDLCIHSLIFFVD